VHRHRCLHERKAGAAVNSVVAVCGLITSGLLRCLDGLSSSARLEPPWQRAGRSRVPPLIVDVNVGTSTSRLHNPFKTGSSCGVRETYHHETCK
jgi:hypothetical protein